MKSLLRYISQLSVGRQILWCYLIWYLVVLVRYFDPNPRIWLTSLGLSGIIGAALYISSTTGGNKLERWQVIRLFLMPFFVSSFAALVKGKDFILIFSSNLNEVFLAAGLCAAFCLVVWIIKRLPQPDSRKVASKP
ncbi:MAG: hypothetical protein ACK4UN_21880, partial [Limisphaerales bacterium]